MQIVEYLFIGAIISIVFLMLLSYNPAVGMMLQHILPVHDFSKRKTLYKALVGIIVAWPAMIVYVIMAYRNRR